MTEFELFRSSNGLSKKYLAEYLGVSNAFITQLVQGIRSLPEDKVKLIKANELGWDTTALDSAPMLKPTAVQQVEGNGGVLTQVAGDLPPIRKIVGDEVEVVPMDNYVAVPFYDLEASAGLPNGDTPIGWVETRLVPRQYAGDEYLVVRVSGDSMDDGTSRSLCHGDEIVVKRELFDPANTLPIRSKLFVVDTMEGAVIKQILECNRSEGTVTLHSFNERYRDYQVPLSEVRGFYSVQCFSMKSIRF